MNMEEFLALKSKEQQRVNFEMTYVDIADGDLIAGLLLSQIIYWFSPDKHGRLRTRATYNGKRAIAKNRKEWYEEIRITPRQYDYGINTLKKLKIVTVVNSMFNGKRTPFIMLNGDVFLKRYKDELMRCYAEATSVSRRSNTGNTESALPLTEITTEITTEIKNIRELPEATRECPLPYYEFDFTTNDKKDIVTYYTETYENYMQQLHPKLKPSQWQCVDDGLGEIYNEEIGVIFDSPEVDEWKLMIDRHFETEYENCDYNILHFVTDGVKVRRMYESVY